MISPRIAVLALSLALTGCAVDPLVEYKKDFDARPPANVVVGAPFHVFDQPPSRIAGLITRDGRAHVFQIDAGRVLRHAEVGAGGVLATTQVATLDEDPSKIALDAIEWPPGTLRVVAGSNLFVRTTESPTWRATRDNRCERFLVVSDRLFCAYVTSGERFGAPKRTDAFGGVFLIVPFGSMVERTARKLVLAEAVADAWVVRAVLDAKDPLDATGPGVIGTDAAGNVHVLHAAGQGGGTVLFLPPYVGSTWSPASKLRYARITSESLRDSSGAPVPPPDQPIILVESREVRLPPWEPPWPPLEWLVMFGDIERKWRAISPLEDRFAVTPESGAIAGLAQSDGPHHVRIRGTRLQIEGVLGVTLRDGQWDESVSVVLTRDWPVANMKYVWILLDPRVRLDSSGALHALAPHCANDSFWTTCSGFGLSYVVKRDGAWSRPVSFGIGQNALSLASKHPQSYALLIPGVERSFIGWIDERAGFTGRWIVPGGGSR